MFLKLNLGHEGNEYDNDFTLLFLYLKIISNEFTGMSHDQIAFFKTFRGTTQVCTR